MIDPMIALAFSIHSNKGAYALLLGSGISRASGIPTGWEVVLDLISKVAKLEGEDCEPDPAAWFRQKHGAEPDYSKLLDVIAKTPTERQQLLREYFEPSEDERSRGLKSPTAAHKAIARLVAAGCIRIIVTTNFDRLTEKALEEAGVTATVISTADQIAGALPLAHSGTTIVKLHGDYLDTRIRNTEVELAGYDPAFDKLLDRIFDEYGLIVCGWSAEWDVALRAAIERCPSRRFTTFWATRSPLAGHAKRLAGHRKAEVLGIRDANQLFETLWEKVRALAELSAPHPLSAKMAVASVKRYVVDDASRIHLHDLVHEETERLFSELNDNNFPLRPPDLSAPEVTNRGRRYEALSEVLLSIVTTGCQWGSATHVPIWVKAIDRIGNPSGERNGAYTDLVDLHRYPALLLIYGGGLAALSAGHFDTLRQILCKPRALDYPQPESLLPHLPYKGVGIGTRLSAHLYHLFQARLRDLLPVDDDFQACFDRFEYLLGIITLDLSQGMRWRVGEFAYHNRHNPPLGVSNMLESELATFGASHQLLKAGFFGGSLEAMRERKAKFDERLSQIPIY